MNKQTIKVTENTKETNCSYCKEQVNKGERVYYSSSLNLTCHLTCGPDAKKTNKKKALAKRKAAEKNEAIRLKAKNLEDIKYHKAIGRDWT